jgi:MFS family permease
VLSALAAGWTIDRFGARRLLPAVLVPMGVGTLLLTYSTAAYVLPVFMALAGLAHGCASTVHGALWAELYGTGHVGAIRSVVAAGMVFASALSPGLIGILLDAGVSLHGQFVAMGAYCLVAALWMGNLAPRLDRLAAA